MTAKLDPLATAIDEFQATVSNMSDIVAELEELAEEGLLLPGQREELANVSELLRSIRQSWRLRLH